MNREEIVNYLNEMEILDIYGDQEGRIHEAISIINEGLHLEVLKTEEGRNVVADRVIKGVLPVLISACLVRGFELGQEYKDS